MQLTFERSGGFAGMTTAATIDTDTLPPEDRDMVCGLVDAANFFDLPDSLIDSAAVDQFSYTIAVDDGERRHTIETNDGGAPESLRPLIDWLARASRRR